MWKIVLEWLKAKKLEIIFGALFLDIAANWANPNAGPLQYVGGYFVSLPLITLLWGLGEIPKAITRFLNEHPLKKTEPPR